MNEAELTELFARLGAPDPARCAHSQVAEGIPKLARFLFLRRAWKLVVDAKETGWIDEQLQREIGAPGGSVVAPLTRLLAKSGSEADLSEVVRVMQRELLFRFCTLLDDPGALEIEVKDLAWQLFQVDEDGQPLAPMTGLHESLLSTKPDGN